MAGNYCEDKILLIALIIMYFNAANTTSTDSEMQHLEHNNVLILFFLYLLSHVESIIIYAVIFIQFITLLAESVTSERNKKLTYKKNR